MSKPTIKTRSKTPTNAGRKTSTNAGRKTSTNAGRKTSKRSEESRSSSRKTSRSSGRRTSKAGQKEEPRGSRRGKKNQPDNTKLFIGIGIGSFVLIIIVIAAIFGGDEKPQAKKTPSQKEVKSKFTLKKNQRKELYKAYLKDWEKLDDEANVKRAAIEGDVEEKRTQGKKIQNSLKAQLRNAVIKHFKIAKEKYPDLERSYYNKTVIDEGDNGKLE